MKTKISIRDRVVRTPWLSIKEMLSTLSDGDYKLSITRERHLRSRDQNSFYWWPFLETLLDEMGEINPSFTTNEDVTECKKVIHEHLKQKFWNAKTKKSIFKNPKNKRNRFTIETTESVSTADMDTLEFEQYLDRIRNYFAQWGWELPYPNEPIEEHYTK